MKYFKRKIAFLALILFFSASVWANSVPESLKGAWSITKIFSSSNNMSSNQVPADQFLKARLTFEPNSVKMVDVNCDNPTIQLQNARLSALKIDDIQSGQTLKSVYGLDLPLNEEGQLIRLTCGKSNKILLPNNDGSSLFTEKAAFLRKNGDLIVALNTDGVYLAHRQSSSEQVKPSFDCKKASSATEKAICANQTLASLDQQAAAIYKSNLTTAKSWGDQGECLKSVKKAQSEWLKKRDSCGADTQCLEKSLRDQISVESDKLQQWLSKDCSVG